MRRLRDPRASPRHFDTWRAPSGRVPRPFRHDTHTMASQGIHTSSEPRGAADTAAVVPPHTPAEVRALFPATTTSTYLNAAASSPLCVPVERVLQAHLRETL